ncbi:hypothetical protein ACWD6I_05215 [Streptomyces sp. NPDC002454]
MRNHWYRELWDSLGSRDGFSVLLTAVFPALAIGMAPNLLQKVWDSGWAYLCVAVVSVMLAVTGWSLGHQRGVGVVVNLLPGELTQDSRLEALKQASTAAHGSTLEIEAGLLSPGGSRLPPTEQADLVARLVDARVKEHLSSGRDGSVTLYPLARMGEGFSLGRRLRRDHHASLGVMHVSRGGGVVHGVLLGDGLHRPLTSAQRAFVDAHVVPPPDGGQHQVVVHPQCPPEHRHRLALVVRLTPGGSMVDDAVHVARTGSVRRSVDRSHTGYVFDEADPEAPGPPCGAHVVLRASVDHLPEGGDGFEALAVQLHRVWAVARDTWAARVGSGVETRLFLAAPLPIAVAFGWLTANENVRVVHHDLRLLNAPAP